MYIHTNETSQDVQKQHHACIYIAQADEYLDVRLEPARVWLKTIMHVNVGQAHQHCYCKAGTGRDVPKNDDVCTQGMG